MTMYHEPLNSMSGPDHVPFYGTTRAAANAGGDRMRAAGWRHVGNGISNWSGKFFTTWQRGNEVRDLTYPQLAAFTPEET
jgi:hypothetical protein